MSIQKLPPHIVDQIAAGEVVERPASVVKELCENAVDAGARQITVRITGGGLTRIVVEDDGGGIPADELALALESHATSKLRTADDLVAIGTLGFRGEALASIASVSRLRLASCVAGADGAELCVAGREREPQRPCGLPRGTVVEVADLFFNVPARRKFLGSARAETSRIKELVVGLALAQAGTGWRLESDGKLLLGVPADVPLVERVARLIDRRLAEQLLPMDLEADWLTGHGLLAPPHVCRGNRKQQLLFLNGRSIVDRTVQAAMNEGYRGLQTPGRFPIWLLFLQLDPAEVDVNVHPRKSEVRIHGERRLFGLLGRRVAEVVSRAAAPPALDFGSVPEPAPRLDPAARRTGSELRERIERYHRRPIGEASKTGRLPLGDAPPVPRPATGAPPAAPAPPPAAAAVEVPRPTPPPGWSAPPPRPVDEAQVGAAVQMHRRYLVEETATGVAIIDQHALHEKILYNRLRTGYEAGRVASQPLLFPVDVEVTSDEQDAVLGAAAELTRLGLAVEAGGPGVVRVLALPQLLGPADPAVLVEGLAHKLGGGGQLKGAGDLVHLTLATMACKAAIKAGDRLTDIEVRQLLVDRATAGELYSCPHGRPTTIELGCDELDRRFGRR